MFIFVVDGLRFLIGEGLGVGKFLDDMCDIGCVGEG